MPKQLKQQVLEANLQLPKHGLVAFTWGNVSGVDRTRGVMVIKPSGVAYSELSADNMVVVDLVSGKKIQGHLNPSSDTPTHIALYQAFDGIGGIVHTHSRWATIFAQLGRGIPPLGTTHADYFHGEIPCTRPLTRQEVEGEYEKATGAVIARQFSQSSPVAVPAALVAGHGPFAWGEDPQQAVHTAVVLEEVAMMAWHTLSLCPDVAPIDRYLLDKHYQRKHGHGAYYGQGSNG